MVAAGVGDKETVEVLVKECSADVESRDVQGNTALMIALKKGRLDTACCLVTELAADSSTSNGAGVSCLHFAASSVKVGSGRKEQEVQAMKVADQLIERGASTRCYRRMQISAGLPSTMRSTSATKRWQGCWRRGCAAVTTADSLIGWSEHGRM